MDGLTPELSRANTVGKKSFSQSASRDRTTIAVRIEPDGRILTFTGREAWMLRRLMEAGSRGLTTLDLPPGVRCSHAIMCLRQAGLLIESPRVAHGGEFPGSHSVYRIMTEIPVIEDAAE